MARTAHFQGFKQVLLASAASLMLANAAQADDAHKKSNKFPPLVPTVTTAGETLGKPDTDVRPGLAGSFLSGRFAKKNQDLKEAAKYMSETLARDPYNEQLQQETMRMHLLAGNIDTATDLAHKLARPKSNEPLVASLLMLEAVKANDFAKAKTTIEDSANTGLFGLIRPVMLEWIEVAADDRKRSVDMKGAIDKAGFFAPFINYHTALMNDVLGNAAAAQVAYTKANSDPGVTPYRVIEAIANFHERQGDWDKAQADYDAYAKANPQSTLIPEKLVKGETPKPLVANAKDGLAELFFTTASILFGEDATQDTFLYLRIALELRPNLPPAQLMLANLYEQLEDYKDAVATYDQIPEGSVFYRRAQIRKALNYEALGQKDKAVALLETLAKKYPNDATALITKGDMQRDAKDYSGAAATYTDAITRTEPLEANDWPLLYARGISYERNGEWDKAEGDFNRALKLQPDQPDVLNYLAYSWLTMGKNLTQAREYLEIASAQRPDDAHIIDSEGWAYYLTGDFKNAVTKFEHAVELTPDDATVNDHLGDAYWRTGRTTEAKYQWERVLTTKPDKDVADAMHEKLANGLPVFVAPAEASKPQPAASIAPLTPKMQVQ